MRALRRLLAIALLVVLGLPLASPLFAQSAESGGSLPACCRRHGTHHCMTGFDTFSSSASSSSQFRAPFERCPYYPAATLAVRSGWITLPVRGAIFAGLVSHPAVVAQTQSMWRIARDRSRQKRGPPAPSI